MKVNRTNLLYILIGLLVLAAAAYMLFFRGSSDSALSSDSTPVSGSEFTFLSLAARIEPIVFDTSILEDPRFTQLKDLRTAIIPENPGRANPFAPL